MKPRARRRALSRLGVARTLPRPGGAVAVGGWQALLERRSGAFECALDRVDAAVEHVSDLRGVEAEHVAKHERCPLSWWEVLERGDERQLDCFPGLVAHVGSGRSVDDALQQNVWVGLKPGGLAIA